MNRRLQGGAQGISSIGCDSRGDLELSGEFDASLKACTDSKKRTVDIKLVGLEWEGVVHVYHNERYSNVLGSVSKNSKITRFVGL